MSISIGFVVSVIGTDIVIQMDEESNKTTYRYNGDLYRGVAIRECIIIQSGIYKIVCKVEGEYLDESKFIEEGRENKKYIRKVRTKPIGYMENNIFYDGNKYLPMIKDPAYLMTDKELTKIYNSDTLNGFTIGKTLKDSIPYVVDINKFFNKHIGIFGNTGSGKSNTLTKLYTELLNNRKDIIKGKSFFVLFDFNGEYVGEQLIHGNSSIYKKVIRLNTKKKQDTITIREENFWDEDILGLLFKATYNTQRPFLKNIVQGRKKYSNKPNSLLVYYTSTINSFLKSSTPRKELKELLISIVNLIQETSNEENLKEITDLLERMLWHNNYACYFYEENGSTLYMNKDNNIQRAADTLCKIKGLDKLEFMDELIVRATLSLINSVLRGYVQFEHISPLINRMNALKQNIKNVINVSNEEAALATQYSYPIVLEVISFRNCNQEIKKIIPLIIAKSYYDAHKDFVSESKIDKTLHFIIDEAHNILSAQSSREEESWKDYRLDLFEEIIKEGRKFGVFMTIASQRPADISTTIMSQFHNFLIHRLVNDKDLAIIDNAISSLDSISKQSIPTLPTGACIITGSSFKMPLIIQVDRIIEKKHRPNSDDVDLESLWNPNNT